MILENVRKIQERMSQAATRAGRSPEDVQLVGVSKTKSAQDIVSAFDAGIKIFGENYVQEAALKIQEVLVARPSAKFHFIGHLQSNKIKQIAPLVNCVQTVDSLKLGLKLNDFVLSQHLPKLDILVQVNVSQEDSKSGVSSCEIEELIAGLKLCEGLNLSGLMTIGSLSSDMKVRRKEFAELRNLRDKACRISLQCAHLSMGMSDDFEIAVEEGATIVRVGSSIFGNR